MLNLSFRLEQISNPLLIYEEENFLSSAAVCAMKPLFDCAGDLWSSQNYAIGRRATGFRTGGGSIVAILRIIASTSRLSPSDSVLL